MTFNRISYESYLIFIHDEPPDAADLAPPAAPPYLVDLAP